MLRTAAVCVLLVSLAVVGRAGDATAKPDPFRVDDNTDSPDAAGDSELVDVVPDGEEERRRALFSSLSPKTSISARIRSLAAAEHSGKKYGESSRLMVLAVGSVVGSKCENFRHQRDMLHFYWHARSSGVPAENIIVLFEDFDLNQCRKYFSGERIAEELRDKFKSTLDRAAMEYRIYERIRNWLVWREKPGGATDGLYRGSEATKDNFICSMTGLGDCPVSLYKLPDGGSSIISDRLTLYLFGHGRGDESTSDSMSGAIAFQTVRTDYDNTRPDPSAIPDSWQDVVSGEFDAVSRIWNAERARDQAKVDKAARDVMDQIEAAISSGDESSDDESSGDEPSGDGPVDHELGIRGEDDVVGEMEVTDGLGRLKRMRMLANLKNLAPVTKQYLEHEELLNALARSPAFPVNERKSKEKDGVSVAWSQECYYKQNDSFMRKESVLTASILSQKAITAIVAAPSHLAAPGGTSTLGIPSYSSQFSRSLMMYLRDDCKEHGNVAAINIFMASMNVMTCSYMTTMGRAEAYTVDGARYGLCKGRERGLRRHQILAPMPTIEEGADDAGDDEEVMALFSRSGGLGNVELQRTRGQVPWTPEGRVSLRGDGLTSSPPDENA